MIDREKPKRTTIICEDEGSSSKKQAQFQDEDDMMGSPTAEMPSMPGAPHPLLALASEQRSLKASRPIVVADGGDGDGNEGDEGDENAPTDRAVRVEPTRPKRSTPTTARKPTSRMEKAQPPSGVSPPRVSSEAERREQEEERAKRVKARRAAQRIAAQRDVLVAREEIERRTRRVEQSVRAKVAYASYVCEQQQQQLARMSGDAGQAGSAGAGGAGATPPIATDPADHDRFLALADDRLRMLAAARQRVAAESAAARLPPGGKLPMGAGSSAAGGAVEGLKAVQQQRLLIGTAVGKTTRKGAVVGTAEGRASAATALRRVGTAPAAMEASGIPANEGAPGTTSNGGEATGGVVVGASGLASKPGWLDSLAGMWRELQPPSSRRDTRRTEPSGGGPTSLHERPLLVRPVLSGVSRSIVIPGGGSEGGDEGDEGDDNAPTDRAVRVETRGATRVHRSASPNKQPSAYMAGASTTSADRAYMHEATWLHDLGQNLGPTPLEHEATRLHEARFEATMGSHGAVVGASGAGFTGDEESSHLQTTNLALGTGKADRPTLPDTAPGYGSQAIIAWSDATWHGRAMSPKFTASNALPGQPLAVRLPGQPEHLYRPDFGELQEVLGIGRDATVVGKDGEQLTLSKWEDEAWGELVRGGSAPLLARCLEIFGVQEEHPHLALECFAQVRLRCLHRKQPSLLEAGVQAAVLAAMKAHLEHRAVQFLGCECLGLLAGYSVTAAGGNVTAGYSVTAAGGHFALKQEQTLATAPTGYEVSELAC